MDFAGATTYLTLALVTARLAGMLIVAPVLGEAAVPARLRLALALVMALALAGRMAVPAALPATALGLLLAGGVEVLIGLAIGYAARLVFVGVELGAFHISQQMGLSLAEVFSQDAPSEEGGDCIRQFFRLLAIVIFLAIGGHRILISGLVQSFDVAPVTSFVNPALALQAVAALLGAAFVLALKLAGPVLIALVLAGVALGFLQRTIPQANILSTGMPVRVLTGFVVVAAMLALGAVPQILSWLVNVLGTELRTLLAAVA